MKSEAEELRDGFFDNEPDALKGRKTLDKYMKPGRANELKHLLRNHEDETVYEEETWRRDEIDYYVEYFSFMALAWMTAQIDVPVSIRDEAKKYLGNKFVRRYYEDHYEQLLPQIMLSLSKKGGGINLIEQESQGTFRRFMRLNNSIRNEEVDSFLWMLDGGVYYEKGTGDKISLKKLRKLLEDPDEFLGVLKGRKRNTKKYSVVQGFLLYCTFLDNYYQFLIDIPDKTVRSAYWHYYGYWFESYGGNLTKVTNTFFMGIQKRRGATAKSISAGIRRYKLAIKNLCYSPDLGKPLKDAYAKVKSKN